MVFNFRTLKARQEGLGLRTELKVDKKHYTVSNGKRKDALAVALDLAPTATG